MFNRLFPKRQCIRPYTILQRNICGLIHNNHTNPLQIQQQNPSQSSCISTVSPLQYQSVRHFGKIIKIYNQPDVGEGTVEVDILEWHVEVGHDVKGLQTIGRGKYEKADIDILAPSYSGKVHRIVVAAGETAIVGKPLIEFETDDDGSTPSDSVASEAKSTKIESSTMYVLSLSMC